MKVPVSSRRVYRRWVVLPVFLAVLLFSGLRSVSAQVEPSEDGPVQTNADVSKAHFISNDTIVRMAKAGLDDTVILQTIETQPGHYDTSPDDLIALKNAGVSQQVIAAMQARSAGLAIHANNKIDLEPLARGIDDIGVYYQDKTGEWVPLKTERVEFKSGGWVKSTFSYNVVKQDLNGEVDQAQSTLVLFTGVNILIYAPAGTQPEEYDFIRFREHPHNREFRVKTGGVFHSETGSQRDDIEFHPHKIAPQMYVFTVPADIQKGEYGVLPPASSNAPGISNAGKIFTFSIRE
ncbi:MAG TPA: hypothetical protein VIJ65_00805 [Acidobacteriaceae bacterium]